MRKRTVTMRQEYDLDLDDIPNWLYDEICKEVIEDCTCWIWYNGEIVINKDPLKIKFDIIKVSREMVEVFLDNKELQNKLHDLRDKFNEAIAIIEDGIKKINKQ